MRFPSFAFVLLIAAGSPASAQQAGADVLAGSAAYGDWRSDAPGLRRWIRPKDLSPPYASRSASNGPASAPLREDPPLQVPRGFAVSLWARGLEGPRRMTVAPNGDVFVAETAGGTIRVLRPEAGGAMPGPATTFAGDLDGPFGMVFAPSGDHPRWLYVATTTTILRFPYVEGDRSVSGPPEKIADLAISAGGHSTRDLALSRDGSTLFVSVGSQSNVAEDMTRLPPGAIPKDRAKGAAWEDEEGRADVLAFDRDGGHRRIVATGIRNCVGLASTPANDDLYCATNERDGLGDDLPPDYVTRVRPGEFFGWPWFYIGDHEDPRHAGERPDLAGAVSVPDVLIQPHSAPLCLAFYDPAPGAAQAFPPNYAGSAFVALHGSWNRSKRTGYKVIRILMDHGVPTGVYEDFLIGFVNPDGRVWGRPVGVAVARDGALLVSEDEHGTIWRITPSR